jgi:hypothetical protein
MARKTKKELILEVCQTEGLEKLTHNEIELINTHLINVYGRGGAASPAYIVSTLLAAGKQIYYQTDLANLEPTTDYPLELTPLLKLDTLTAAEEALCKLDELFHQSLIADDQTTMARCREFAQRARLRAQLLAENEQLPAENRRMKAEIASWLALWLLTPDLFTSWLELRKCSTEYKQLFA